MLRKALAARLRVECGFDVVPAVANFLLCHLPADGPDAQRLVEECRRCGLFIRDASTMGVAMGRHVVRLAVKDQATNDRMVEIVKRALSSRSQTLNGNGSADAPAGARAPVRDDLGGAAAALFPRPLR